MSASKFAYNFLHYRRISLFLHTVMRFRILASLSALLLCCQAMNAQTNVQLHYDFGRNIYSGKKGGLDLSKEGSNRQAMTMTVEHFNVDRFGSNFFFVDLDFVPGSKAFRGAYFEISRELCFWKGTPVEGLSAHIEYNGGLDRYSGSYDDAYLLGPTYSFHSKDWSFTGSVTAMYKIIPGNAKNMHNFQLTGVWNWTFCKGMLSFNGFADFWMENRPWQLGAKGDKEGDGTDFIFISEPQLWFNFNSLKAMEKCNLSVGTELEISSNFLSAGAHCCPTIALKYVF